MTSVPRSASDWVGDCISDAHQHVYGGPIEWTYLDKDTCLETIPFVEERMPMPKGWTGLYNVHPNLLVERGFDKVIVLRRDKREWIRVTLLYYLKVLSKLKEKGRRLEEFKWAFDVKKSEVIRDLTAQWDSIFTNLPKSERCYLVNLEDLNNHTVDTFNELFDFLEFRRFYNPIFGRPIIMPIKPPLRNWEKYSARLPRAQEYCESLEVIGELYAETMTKILDDKLKEWD